MSRAQPLDAKLSLVPLSRPLMTGEVLDAGFRLFRAGLLRTLPYSGLAVLVFELPAVFSMFFLPSSPRGSGSFFTVSHERATAWVVATLLGAALLGVITLRLQAVSKAVRPRFRTEIATVIRRWPASLIASLGAFGAPFLLFSLSKVLNNLLPGAALIFIGALLLWPMALLVVALPAFWCDGLGPFAAIAQALRVSRRRSWRMFGAMLATAGMVTVFYAVSTILIAMLSQMIGRADLFLIATVSSMMSLVVGAFGVPFVLAVLIVAYEDLKLRRQMREWRA